MSLPSRKTEPLKEICFPQNISSRNRRNSISVYPSSQSLRRQNFVSNIVAQYKQNLNLFAVQNKDNPGHNSQYKALRSVKTRDKKTKKRNSQQNLSKDQLSTPSCSQQSSLFYEFKQGFESAKIQNVRVKDDFSTIFDFKKRKQPVKSMSSVKQKPHEKDITGNGIYQSTQLSKRSQQYFLKDRSRNTEMTVMMKNHSSSKYGHRNEKNQGIICQQNKRQELTLKLCGISLKIQQAIKIFSEKKSLQKCFCLLSEAYKQLCYNFHQKLVQDCKANNNKLISIWRRYYRLKFEVLYCQIQFLKAINKWQKTLKYYQRFYHTLKEEINRIFDVTSAYEEQADEQETIEHFFSQESDSIAVIIKTLWQHFLHLKDKIDSDFAIRNLFEDVVPQIWKSFKDLPANRKGKFSDRYVWEIRGFYCVDVFNTKSKVEKDMIYSLIEEYCYETDSSYFQQFFQNETSHQKANIHQFELYSTMLNLMKKLLKISIEDETFSTKVFDVIYCTNSHGQNHTHKNTPKLFDYIFFVQQQEVFQMHISKLEREEESYQADNLPLCLQTKLKISSLLEKWCNLNTRASLNFRTPQRGFQLYMKNLFKLLILKQSLKLFEEVSTLIQAQLNLIVRFTCLVLRYPKILLEAGISYFQAVQAFEIVRSNLQLRFHIQNIQYYHQKTDYLLLLVELLMRTNLSILKEQSNQPQWLQESFHYLQFYYEQFQPRKHTIIQSVAELQKCKNYQRPILNLDIKNPICSVTITEQQELEQEENDKAQYFRNIQNFLDFPICEDSSLADFKENRAFYVEQILMQNNFCSIQRHLYEVEKDAQILEETLKLTMQTHHID